MLVSITISGSGNPGISGSVGSATEGKDGRLGISMPSGGGKPIDGNARVGSVTPGMLGSDGSDGS